ncbi:MAG: SDR family oxidoreductase [Emcibacter sp.]|nr:SDR family oxidoreductase [Emcibacter sp.]
MNRLKNKIAIVTGGNSGIGAASVKRMAEEGASVLITGQNEQRGSDVVDEIIQSGGAAFFMKQDVGSKDGWKEILEACQTRYGVPDILFNNAGVSLAKPVTKITPDEVYWILKTNVSGTFLGIQTIISALRDAGKSGSIINNASIFGLVGSPFQSIYSASKGAVLALTRSVAIECAQMKDGIRVNSIVPGSIWTPIFTKESPDGGKSLIDVAGNEKNAKDLIAQHTPLNKVGEPNDIAHAVVYLASDESQFVTGTEIIIDGGVTAH